MDGWDVGELYAASYRRLVLQLLVVCGDLADAEDAVQEAFVKAVGSRELARADNPEAWLRTVAHNHLRNVWRHASVVRKYQAAVPGPRASVDLGPDHVAIVAALQELPPDQRRMMALHYFADLGTAQIAAELGLREGTVKSRLSRAKARLAVLLDDREASGHA